MSGYKFAESATRIFDASSQKHFIVSPTKRLLKLMLLLFIAGVTLITLSSGFWCIATIPALLFEIYFYYLFCKLWRSYNFSKLYLILMPIATAAASIGLKALFNY